MEISCVMDTTLYRESINILEVKMKRQRAVKSFGTKILDYMSVITVFLLFVGMIY